MKMVLSLSFCMNEIQTPKLKQHHYRERRNPQPIMSLGAPMTPEMWVILHTTRVKFFDALIITCRNLEERAKYIYQRQILDASFQECFEEFIIYIFTTDLFCSTKLLLGPNFIFTVEFFMNGLKFFWKQHTETFKLRLY